MRIPVAIFSFVIAILVWCLYGSLSTKLAGLLTHKQDINLALAGSWGDTYGAFTALFSVIGTLGVVWTLVLQQKSIDAQARDLHKQRFDTNFFELLKLLKESRQALRFQHSPKFISGKYPSVSPKLKADLEANVFDLAAVIRARTEVNWWIEQEYAKGPLDQRGLANLFTYKLFNRYPGRYGAYFRMVYSTMQRIHQDKYLSAAEKADYARLLRAQFTEDEIILLALNGLTKMSGRMYELAVDLRMLKYMRDRGLGKIIKPFYPPSAAQPRD